MRLLSVPANLLLLGEYAVLEPGGLGLTLAIERRITATIAGAARLSIAGVWGGGRETWPPVGSSSLLACAAAAAAERFRLTEQELRDLPLCITVDSRPFYDERGVKAGFGSSAATAVAVCYALADYLAARRAGRAAAHPGRGGAKDGSLEGRARPLEGTASPAASVRAFRTVGPRGIVRPPGIVEPPALAEVFAAALAAHRAFQGGGSGYDVAASLYGGLGRFEGGEHPRFRRLFLPWLPPMLLVRGRSPVRTPHAVGRYREWKALYPAEAARFLEESNRCVEGFAAASSWEEGAAWLAACRDLGIKLGEAIGVPARLDLPAPGRAARARPAMKALGAGNEVGVLFLEPGAPHPEREAEAGLLPLPVAEKGVDAYEA